MSVRTVSPGAALLRASRVFSIPPPISRPSSDPSSVAVFNSDTATLLHPTHQTITTQRNTIGRGDWGLKRPLPLRSTTKTSTPLLRIKAIDTWEHITDYGSAADHALNLVKFLEMDIPISTPKIKNKDDPHNPGRRSVFDDEIDQIAPTGEEQKNPDVRWKFKGPWLAGQTEGDFQRYLAIEVRKRKLEFNQRLRTECAKELTQARLKAERDRVASEIEATTEENDAEEETTAEKDVSQLVVEASDVTQKELTDYTKALRNDRRKLFTIIRDFLDLPPAPNPPNRTQIFSQLENFVGDEELILPVSHSPYADRGPPKTHPSAGLSYSRSAAHMFNHPAFGPQKNKPPIQGRVIMPKNAAVGNFPVALGVGGFVTDLPIVEQSMALSAKYISSKPVIPGTVSIEPGKVGGSKTYIQPHHATIDPKGRVILAVEVAHPDAIAILEGNAESIPKRQERKWSGTLNQSTGYSRATNEQGQEGYGLNIKGTDK